MTLDVSIGKVCIRREGNNAYVSTKLCPPEPEDICDPEMTIHPKEAKRSGSIDFFDFFKSYLPDIYSEMRDNPGMYGYDVAFIEPFLERINDLPDVCGHRFDNDRMKWLKFWCNRAVELYGDNAGICFS